MMIPASTSALRDEAVNMLQLDADSPSRRRATGAAARLIVDCDALAENYRTIVSSTAAEVAGVVKADSYGLGVSGVAPALYSAGCRTFFTAFCHEAVEFAANAR